MKTQFPTLPLLAGVTAISVALIAGAPAMAQGLPALQITSPAGADQTQYSLSLQILALMTALTVLPSIVLGASAFTRIIIVLSILRQALGTQQTPPNQVLVAIALFLGFFVMQPMLTLLYAEAVGPYLDGDLGAPVALEKARVLISGFLIENTRQNDLMMFMDLSGSGPYENNEDVPLAVMLPAFITSELKTAFQIGFLLFLPFLVIDMVIASILMALGMMMLSPMLVSLPFKLLLFVLVDGWALTMGSLVNSFSSGVGG